VLRHVLKLQEESILTWLIMLLWQERRNNVW